MPHNSEQRLSDLEQRSQAQRGMLVFIREPDGRVSSAAELATLDVKPLAPHRACAPVTPRL